MDKCPAALVQMTNLLLDRLRLAQPLPNPARRGAPCAPRLAGFGRGWARRSRSRSRFVICTRAAGHLSIDYRCWDRSSSPTSAPAVSPAVARALGGGDPARSRERERGLGLL